MLCNQFQRNAFGIIRSSIALLTGTNVTTCFQHHLFNITRSLSLVHSIRLFNTHLHLFWACRSRNRCPRFSLSFTTRRVSASSSPSASLRINSRWFANYLWRSSAEGLLSFRFPWRWPVRFARPPHELILSRVFHLLYSILVLTTGLGSRHTRLCMWRCGLWNTKLSHVTKRCLKTKLRT